VQPDGKKAYVSCMTSNQVAVIDLDTWKLGGLISTGKPRMGWPGRGAVNEGRADEYMKPSLGFEQSSRPASTSDEGKRAGEGLWSPTFQRETGRTRPSGWSVAATR